MIDFLGLPVSVVLVVVAFALLAGGLVVIRRISRVDPDPRVFRATTHPDALDRVVRGVALAAVVFAAVFALGVFAG